MSTRPLRTYLRKHRQRSALTHEEIAFLATGAMAGTSYSRHERLLGTPTLHTALVYEFLFDTPISQLYFGLSIELQEAVVTRARGLLANLKRKPETARQAYKIATLESIIARGSEEYSRCL